MEFLNVKNIYVLFREMYFKYKKKKKPAETRKKNLSYLFYFKTAFFLSLFDTRNVFNYYVQIGMHVWNL